MRRLERWIFAPAEAERLAALRIGLCALLAWRLSRGLYLGLAGQPRALYRPLSYMKLLPGMPPRAAVLALQAAGVACAVAAAAGVRARLTLPVAWGCAAVLGGMHTSIGKVMHNDVMLMLALVPLLAAPVADAWAPGARERRAPGVRYGWPVRTAMLVVAGAYVFAGLAKVFNSGPAWVASGNLRWVLYTASDSQATPNAVALFVADRAWLATLLAAATLALELTFPAAFASARARACYAAGAVGLHFGIWASMGLDYWAWIGTVVVVMVDWPAVVARLRRARAPAYASR